MAGQAQYVPDPIRERSAAWRRQTRASIRSPKRWACNRPPRSGCILGERWALRLPLTAGALRAWGKPLFEDTALTTLFLCDDAPHSGVDAFHGPEGEARPTAVEVFGGI